MTDPRDADDIEAIKRLKADYFRLLDSKQWPALGRLFTEDAILDSRDDSPNALAQGREAIVTMVATALEEAVTSHKGHSPAIELDGSDAASGTWTMEDRLVFGSDPPSLIVEGRGHYHETYLRGADGRWRIQELRLRRSRLVHNGKVLIERAPPDSN